MTEPTPPSTEHVESFEPDRILQALCHHHVQFVVVGGVAARAHGARRATTDLDCVLNPERANLERVAAALRDLSARLRVAGMSDGEARRLPVRIDARTLAAFGSSTWMTDGGPLDLLVELRMADGSRRSFAELFANASVIHVGTLTARVAALADVIGSKEFANRPKDREALPELRGLLSRQGDA